MKLLPKKNSSFRRVAGSFALAFLAIASWAVAADAPAPLDRSWELKLSGQSSGSFIESSVTGDEGKVTTKETMVMVINRLGSKVSITNETETVENRDGEMQSLLATTSSSQAATHLRVTRADHNLQIETEAGGKSYEKIVPITGLIVGPKGIERLSRENLKRKER